MPAAGTAVQLVGMAAPGSSGATATATLPTSNNLFINYPQTMWEKDSDGNRIPVQIVKQEGGTATVIATTTGGGAVQAITQQDLLGQAAATIKTEQQPAGQPQVAQVIVTSRPRQGGNKGDPNAPRPHTCDVCDKTFVKREHLTKHLRIHKTDNKRYACEFCQKAFRDRYELVRHTRRHTGDFPFR